MKLKGSYRGPQSCICLSIREDSTFILKPVSLLLVVHIQNSEGTAKTNSLCYERMVTVAPSYPITELELCWLVINITVAFSFVQENQF